MATELSNLLQKLSTLKGSLRELSYKYKKGIKPKDNEAISLSNEIQKVEKQIEDIEEKQRVKSNEARKNIPSIIYTRYLAYDKKIFSMELQEIMKEKDGEVLLNKLNKLIETVSKKAIGRMSYQYSRGVNPRKTLINTNAVVKLDKKEIEDIGTATNAVFKSFSADVLKAKVLGNYNKEEFERRAEQIANCEVARITNRASSIMAQKIGIKTWIWGASSSKNPREEHEILYGVKSEIGETPEENGYFPSEAPNCSCQMIFLNR